MDWMKVGSAVLLIMMIFMIYPRLKHELKHGKKGTQKEWLGVAALFGGVALFVWLLMMSVR